MSGNGRHGADQISAGKKGRNRRVGAVAIGEARPKIDFPWHGSSRWLIALLNELLPPAMGGGRVGEIKGVLHLGDMIDSGDKGTGELSVRRRMFILRRGSPRL